MYLKSYSFLDVIASFGGPTGAFNLNNGIEEGGIKITMRGEKNIMTVGADGKVMHSLRADNSAEVSIRLLKTSPTNALLNTMYNLQRIDSTLWGQNVITLNHAIGDEVVATQVAFKKQPDVVYSEAGGMNEWLFDCGVSNELLMGTLV